MHNSLGDFHPAVRTWFTRCFDAPSPPQEAGWSPISRGEHTLILAPTGSGKTLAAFLWAINHLIEQQLHGEDRKGIKILYVSPLKALTNDIERNLQEPLRGITAEVLSRGLPLRTIRTAVRTGDTPQSERSSMQRNPPDILATTPESLYLLLTSPRARTMLTTVQYVIVDEIHSVCNNKRGVHLSLTLERLEALTQREFLRIGLSATQKPLEEIARFLGGQQWVDGKLTPRPVAIVDTGARKQTDLMVLSPVQDLSGTSQELVWEQLFARIVDLIRAHRTTLIFVNNRRLAERVASRVSDLLAGTSTALGPHHVPWRAGQQETPCEIAVLGDTGEPVRAHHGSMSRESRESMERDLKEGKLRALVATTSLELGIDIGSIDLVVQIQSPKGIARGLQRVGRSGHLVHATSKGRIIPTYREDLVEAAVAAHMMISHDVERTSIPRLCLDVLAQQIVAMVSVEEWDVDELHDILRRSYCFQDLTYAPFSGVLRMLAGRYATEAFRDLRARISWDKVNNRLKSLPGSSSLAITNGGTITDKGTYGVYLTDGKTRIGDVDEEFIFESRPGDTFILGTQVWRMTDIDANRVTVSPAPGEPARMPFWRGEGMGRTPELSRKVGEVRRMIAGRIDTPGCLGWLQQEFPIDGDAAWNILEYFRRQKQRTDIIPHDRLILIESFRDEVGDPRIVVHSCFGRRVNGLLGMYWLRRIRSGVETQPQMLYNDDGILFRFQGMEEVPPEVMTTISSHEAAGEVLDEVLSSPLFGGQFRQNAVRALLLPRSAPGKRTPLWLQRLKAGDLLEIARRADDFPIVMETVREVMHDILDVDAFMHLLQNMESGTISLQVRRTEVPSPFAASLLFDFMSVYMYEWDQPRADRVSRFVGLNRELLSEITDLGTGSELLRPEAVETVDSQLQHKTAGSTARSAEELLEILVRLGDLNDREINERSAGDGQLLLDELLRDGRATRTVVGEETRWIAGEDQDLYASLPSPSSAQAVVHRYARTHGVVSIEQMAGRYALDRSTVRGIVSDLSSSGELVPLPSEIRTDVPEDRRLWSFRHNLSDIHNQSIAILRKEIHPCEPPQFMRFLLRWQNVNARYAGIPDAAMEQSYLRLRGTVLPLEVWERDIFRIRVRGYRPDMVSERTASGEMVWVGAGTGKIRLLARGEGAVFLHDEVSPVLASLPDSARKIFDYLKEQGASFFSDLRSGTGLSLHALNNALADLFWNGLITNDQFREISSLRRMTSTSAPLPDTRVELLDARHNPMRARVLAATRRSLRQVPGWTGRWSPVHTRGVMGPPLTQDEAARRQAELLLDRYGILAREFYRNESLLPWSLLCAHLQMMELRGEIRRGYFVSGLSGMQFAHPRAVEELRACAATDPYDQPPIILNACDPANQGPPASPETGGLTRIPSNYVALHDGKPVLLIEANGSRLRTTPFSSDDVLRRAMRSFLELTRLPEEIRGFRNITVEYIDGNRPAGGQHEAMLRSLGFRREKAQTMMFDDY